ncbi:Swt1 family HEPN domain-containing protein [Acetobacter senegalensis]|uniref:Swt1 family HEPN domain-containing protein n=1 Tax=Acetobacter senegalensis TaxID=446692 RepID=UPI00128AFD6A|nr:Swt1 family HEPN domain-containing protein [Acetobacter senegalensis]MCG4256740.1 hypothetical protein [Acetobacter senegalensis]MCG4266699.1 hypothetical protein [Acetobacter senegalensis]MPQ74278.1 hypothetical protein [Acetobacter senegalensis]
MDDDDKASGELPADRLSKIERALYASPATELAREYANSPVQQLAKQVALGLSPAFSVSETAYIETMRKIFEPATAQTETLKAIQPLAIDHAKFVSSGGIIPSIDPKVSAAIQGVQQLNSDLPLASVVSQEARLLEEVMSAVGSIGSTIKRLEEQQLTVPKSMLVSLAGPFGDVAKTSQWMSTLSQIDIPDIAKSLGGGLGTVVNDMRVMISKRLIGSAALNQAKMNEMLGLTSRLGADFATTKLKMSAFAGICEAFDPRSHFQLDAYHSLFGEWRTRVDLPENFWRDGRVREHMYREANVDEGLIVAEPGTAIEIMIESGLTAGLRSEANAVAVVTLGEVSMTVRSRSPSKDAYALVGHFEQKLRVYVERKLEERFGPDWFKLRASNLIGKAKNIRKAAMARGEAFASLVNFTELGELSGIIQSTKNWDEVFGEVFVEKTEFDHDMQKLIAVRRPTMHMRRIDGVRLVEAICVMQRLSEQIADDGAWKVAAETDR